MTEWLLVPKVLSIIVYGFTVLRKTWCCSRCNNRYNRKSVCDFVARYCWKYRSLWWDGIIFRWLCLGNRSLKAAVSLYFHDFALKIIYQQGNKLIIFHNIWDLRIFFVCNNRQNKYGQCRHEKRISSDLANVRLRMCMDSISLYLCGSCSSYSVFNSPYTVTASSCNAVHCITMPVENARVWCVWNCH